MAPVIDSRVVIDMLPTIAATHGPFQPSRMAGAEERDTLPVTQHGFCAFQAIIPYHTADATAYIGSAFCCHKDPQPHL